jgi:hypothetical protein
MLGVSPKMKQISPNKFSKIALFVPNSGRKFCGFLFSVVIAALSFLVGADDQKSVELYLQKLQSLSPHQLDNAQKHYVVDYYLHNSHRNPSPARRRKIRAEFNSRKHKLEQKWSSHYSLKWPEETNPFQAHHIIPINAGGENHRFNITPLSDENHREIHAPTKEHACFSHNFFEQKFYRLILNMKEMYYELTKRISARGNGTEPTPVSQSGFAA